MIFLSEFYVLLKCYLDENININYIALNEYSEIKDI